VVVPLVIITFLFRNPGPKSGRCVLGPHTSQRGRSC
jgi:hypothetical protein